MKIIYKANFIHSSIEIIAFFLFFFGKSKNLFLKSEQFNTMIGMRGGNLGLGEEPDFYYKLVMSNKNVKLYNKRWNL